MAQLNEAFWGSVVPWIAVLAAVLMVLAGGLQLAKRIREKSLQQEPETGQFLIKCRELHSAGVLSDAEFRTIKTTLATQLQEELKHQ
jgi:hypothetical protein